MIESTESPESKIIPRYEIILNVELNKDIPISEIETTKSSELRINIQINSDSYIQYIIKNKRTIDPTRD